MDSFVVITTLVNEEPILGGAYHVPKANDEQHAVNQVRQWLYVKHGIKAPWEPGDETSLLKIKSLSAVKLDKERIHAI